LFIKSYPPAGDPIQITKEQGLQPVWSRDGRELFFHNNPDEMLSVAIDAHDGITLGTPKPFPRPFVQGGPTRVRNYDIAPDGRLVAVVPVAVTVSNAPQIWVIVNWVEELKQRLGID
jgi:hypothetical protein